MRWIGALISLILLSIFIPLNFSSSLVPPSQTSIVLQLQLRSDNSTKWVHELSNSLAHEYAQAHGYEYRLIEWIISPYQLDEWHSSWYVLDAIRQTLHNSSVGMVLFVGETTLLNEVDVGMEEYFQMHHSDSEIFFPTIMLDCFRNPGAKHCQSALSSLHLWKNTDFTRELSNQWLFCANDMLEIPTCFEYRQNKPPYAVGAFADYFYRRIAAHKVAYPITCSEKDMLEDSLSIASRPLLEKNHFCTMVYNSEQIPAVSDTLSHHNTLSMQAISSQEYKFREGYCPSSFIETMVSIPASIGLSSDASSSSVDVIFRMDIHSSGNRKQHRQCQQHMHFTKAQCTSFFQEMHRLQRHRMLVLAQCHVDILLPKVLERYAERQRLLSHLSFTNTLQSQPLLPHQLYVPPRKIIVTIFAGRYDRLQLTMKYWRLALDKKMIDEVHLWDYCRNEMDRILLHTFVNVDDSRIQIKRRHSSRRMWIDYYEYYDDYAKIHLHDVIIKCDDDIFFIDLHMLSQWIDVFVKNEQFAGLLFPNIVNNGVTAYHQQHTIQMLPSVEDDIPTFIDDYEYPEDGLRGTLWGSPAKAYRLHQYFLQHWKELLPAFTGKVYQPHLIPVPSRFSINMFGIRADQWFRIRDIGEDDELHSTVTLVMAGLLKNYIVSNFIVSHLSYGAQENIEEAVSDEGIEKLDAASIINQYEQLYAEYVQYL